MGGLSRCLSAVPCACKLVYASFLSKRRRLQTNNFYLLLIFICRAHARGRPSEPVCRRRRLRPAAGRRTFDGMGPTRSRGGPPAPARGSVTGPLCTACPACSAGAGLACWAGCDENPKLEGGRGGLAAARRRTGAGLWSGRERARRRIRVAALAGVRVGADTQAARTCSSASDSEPIAAQSLGQTPARAAGR